MTKEKIVVTGLCPFCEEEHPVHIKDENDGYLLGSENYLMDKHQKPHNDGSFCKGGETPPDAIIVNQKAR